jgi:hypothetical protein
MNNQARSTAGVLASLCLLAFTLSRGGSQNQPQNPPPSGTQSQTRIKSHVVYVCLPEDEILLLPAFV